MPISEALAPGTVVRVPFPYTDAETRQHRPALVVATAGAGPFLVWVLMITSAANRGWPGDIEIADPDAAGLPVASIIRTAKIATIEAASAEARGHVSAAELASVRQVLAERLGVAHARGKG